MQMILRISLLSEKLLETMMSHTQSLSLILERPPAVSSNVSIYGSQTLSRRLNTSICMFADLIPSFKSLESFSFCNYSETSYSWNAVFAGTFERLLMRLRTRKLQSVTIDIPGAPFETRSKMHVLTAPEAHICDFIRFNLPDAKVIHLRLREICSQIFRLPCDYPRLERILISLDLGIESWQELDLDVCAVECWDYELLGKRLVEKLNTNALSLLQSTRTPRLISIEFKYPVIQGRSITERRIDTFMVRRQD
jgi:hypothetical protein